jgi:PAS domain S-box-containing protein
MLGYPRAELLRRNFLELSFPEDLPNCLELTARLAAGEIPSYRHEKRFVRPDGTLVWMCVTVSAVRDAHGSVDFFIGMAEDISERRRADDERQRAEAQLQRARDVAAAQEAQLRALANAIPQMVWVADNDGRRTWFNERWYAYTGMARGEPEGYGWQAAHHPEHGARVIEAQRRAFARGDVWEDSFPLRAADGTYRWFLSRAVPMRGASGAVVRWFGTNTDVTEHMETLRAAERAKQLRDEMVAVVAHDLRNPLHTIALAAGTLESPTLDPRRRDRLHQIVRETSVNMGRLLDDLLDVSRLDSGTFAVLREPVSAPQLVEAMERLFEARAADKDIAWSARVEPSVPELQGDARRLEQVLSNLIGNAFKFTPRGGQVSLHCRPVAAGVEFTVSDTGCGIAPPHLEHLFERFWKADPASRSGAGLGLAIARGIVDAHGGRIWAESEPGAGSRFHVELPAASPAD